MAFNPQYIDPTNLNPNIGLGVSIPFVNPGVFTTTYTTQEAIKNNLINFFLTNPGELPLNPNFGAGLRKFLFEQIAPPSIQEIQDYVQNKLDLYFPMIQIDTLNVLINQQDNNTLTVQLKYFVPSYNLSGVLNFQF